MVARFVLPGLVFLTALALYWATLAPGATGGDSGEFQFAPYILGIPHHTGYPLYTLLGKVWSFLPLGSVAYRMNLLSAVFGAGTVAITFLLGQEITRSRLAGLVGAAALAMVPLFWHWATIAGVRSASVFLPALILWLAVGWAQRRMHHDDRDTDRWLVATAFAFGLGLAHHRSAAYLGPALLLFVLLMDWRALRRRRTLGLAVAATLAPLLTYLYLPLRSRMGAPFDQFHPDTWERFWGLVGAVPLSQSFFSAPANEIGTRLTMAVAALGQEFGWPGLALATAGIMLLALQQWKTLMLLGIFLAATVAQTMAWNVGQEQLNVVYLMPAFPVVAAAVAAGLDGGARLGASVIGRLWAGGRAVLTPMKGRLSGKSRLDLILRAALAVLALWWFAWLGIGLHQRRVAAALQPLDGFRSDLSHGTAAQRLVLSSLPYLEPNALVVAHWEQATPFWYYQFVEGMNIGVVVSYAIYDLDGLLEENPNRPTYLAVIPPQTVQKRLTMVGPLVKLVNTADTAPSADIARLDARLEGGLTLSGAVFFDSLGRRSQAPADEGDILAVQLYWQSMRLLDGDYSVSVRLVDAKGQVMAQQDNPHPVLGLYHTSRWSAGEVVGDYYELPRQSLPEGEYRLEVVVYERLAQGFRNLRVLDAEGRPGGEVITVASGVKGGSH